ncbi:unnamed protein product, partial [Brassica oleracea]
PTLVGGSTVDACYSPESSYGKFVPSVDFSDLRSEPRRERTDRQYHNSRLGPIHDDYKRLNHHLLLGREMIEFQGVTSHVMNTGVTNSPRSHPPTYRSHVLSVGYQRRILLPRAYLQMKEH